MVRYDRTLLEQSAAAAGNAPGDLSGRRRKADVAPAEPQLAVEIPQQLRLHIPPLLKKVVLDDSEQVGRGAGGGGGHLEGNSGQTSAGAGAARLGEDSSLGRALAARERLPIPELALQQ